MALLPPFLAGTSRKKRTQIIAIDLGSRTSKAVLLERRGETFLLTRYALLDAPISDDGADGDSAAHEVADSRFEPQRVMEQTEMSRQIQAAVAALPEKLRSVLILHDMEGMPYEEIAQVVGCPLGTVKSRLFNARLQLRQRLSSYLQS